MNVTKSSSKAGVYIDVSNIYRNGGSRMQYDVLREFACRDGVELVRLNAYVSFDADRAKKDRAYNENTNRFFSVLRDYGYKVIVKEVKWYEDDSGKRFGKANADLDLAVDMLLQSQNLDRILLVTGDGDFTQVVRAVQNRGCRVEILALDNVSMELRHEADMYISGYIVPNLLPTSTNNSAKWGEPGSRVRGVCYFHKQDGDFGFMRYLTKIVPEIWQTDTQHINSPYQPVYFHDSHLPGNVNPANLPSHSHIFEFELTPSTRDKDSFQAKDIKLIS